MTARSTTPAPAAPAALAAPGRLAPGRAQGWRLWALCLAALAAAALLAVVVGAVAIPPGSLLRLLAERLLGLAPALDVPAAYRTILFDIRLPRVALVALSGAALASAGAAYQGLFRNPLADPYLVGVAAGAGLGATLVWRS
jgi:iron complex transport system permease protein